jgi:[FeFe] hydrogenase H-cluster maturation GTPase HydF
MNERVPRTESDFVRAAKTPGGMHIGLFGRRSVGKSSLLNALARQATSLVSDQAGTTTEPADKPMELSPLGPVLFVNTAGIDDIGALGAPRVQRTRLVLDRTDVAVLVTDETQLGPYEKGMIEEFRARAVPVIVVFNKIDVTPQGAAVSLVGECVWTVQTSAVLGLGLDELREALSMAAPEASATPPILVDLVGPGELAVLVVPVDKAAPMGRPILPQAQAMRDLLDGNAMCLVVQDTEVCAALGRLRVPPKLVVTDSQAFLEVAARVPRTVPMTSFSILFARLKGELKQQVLDTMAIDGLRPGDSILIVEACPHHPIDDDIARVKIPRLLNAYVGGELRFAYVQGHDFPQDLGACRLVVHCGACMLNRKEVQNRLLRCKRAGVPMTNHGLTIAFILGLFERALTPFPEALDAFRGCTKAPAGV